jgi:hypothetical protein
VVEKKDGKSWWIDKTGKKVENPKRYGKASDEKSYMSYYFSFYGYVLAPGKSIDRLTGKSVPMKKTFWDFRKPLPNDKYGWLWADWCYDDRDHTLYHISGKTIKVPQQPKKAVLSATPTDQVFPYFYEGKYGFINTNGELVIPCNYYFVRQVDDRGLVNVVKISDKDLFDKFKEDEINKLKDAAEKEKAAQEMRANIERQKAEMNRPKEKCKACNGTGKTGAGSTTRCSSCGGAGWSTCGTCSGSGWRSANAQCYACNGTGKKTCWNCNGKGVIANDDAPDCKTCGGTGER